MPNLGAGCNFVAFGKGPTQASLTLNSLPVLFKAFLKGFLSFFKGLFKGKLIRKLNKTLTLELGERTSLPLLATF